MTHLSVVGATIRRLDSQTHLLLRWDLFRDAL
jgi:hypothetical protein